MGRKRRIAGWLTITSAMALLALFVISGRYSIGIPQFFVPSGRAIVERGQLEMILGMKAEPPTYDMMSWALKWTLSTTQADACEEMIRIAQGAVWVKSRLGFFGTSRFNTILYLPIFPYAAALAPIGVLLLAWGARRKRAAVGHCPRCRYDLSTLPTTTPCPECGQPRTP